MKESISSAHTQSILALNPASVRLPFSPFKLWSKSTAHRNTIIIWFFLCLLIIPSGMLTRVFDWSGIPIELGGETIHLTVYIPMLFCVPIALWLGYWWANLRTLRSILTFSAFSLLSSLTGSAGAYVWAHTNSVGLDSVFPIWQGWWLGGWLQSMLIVAPVLALIGGRVEKRVSKLSEQKPNVQDLIVRSLPMVWHSVAILLAYVFAARYLAYARFESLATKELQAESVTPLLEMVNTLSYPIFLMTGVIIGLVYFGYRSLFRWTERFNLLNQELRSQNQQLEKLATIDALSGVFNRRKVFSLIAAEFIRAKRTRQSMTIVMSDADHFKSINHNHGHHVGDQVIRQLAIRLEGALRDYDVLGRYGGEEFIVMLPQTTVKEASQVANRIREVVELRPLNTTIGDVDVTVSIGCATQAEEDEDFKEIVERADHALYRAKARGRNCVETMVFNTDSLL